MYTANFMYIKWHNVATNNVQRSIFFLIKVHEKTQIKLITKTPSKNPLRSSCDCVHLKVNQLDSSPPF